MIKVSVFHTGKYLIEHPQGNILIDTGWDTKYAHTHPKEWFGMVDRISAPIITEEEGIDRKLAVLGLCARDIGAVYLSHMDFDHTSGLRLVQDAGGFYASAEEIRAAGKNKFRYVDTWSGICTIQPFSYQKSGVGPFGKSYDVFGDGSVELVSIPGHSRGLFAVRISEGSRYLILANDGAYLQESFDQRILPGFTVDKAQAAASLDWLCSCRQDPNCLAVLPNHDPTVQEKTWEIESGFG